LKGVNAVELYVSACVDRPAVASIDISFFQERPLLVKNNIIEEVTVEVRRLILRGFRQTVSSKIESDGQITV
jgi:hypothetical protein